jgi:hypothetical protein
MNRAEIRAFSRLLKRMSCAQLKRMLKKNKVRLVAALSAGGWFLRAKLIRTLKAKRKMIKARIRIKCNSGSSGGFLGGITGSVFAKLKACQRKAALKYPMPSGGIGNIFRRARVVRLRKAYVRRCMAGNTGFNGGYSNLPGILPGTTHTSIPRPFGPNPGPIVGRPTPTIPARPEPTPNPIRPGRPTPIGEWPIMPPQQSVPYHTHHIYETPPVAGGYATTGPRGISNPYSIPRPIKRPLNIDTPVSNASGSGVGASSDIAKTIRKNDRAGWTTTGVVTCMTDDGTGGRDGRLINKTCQNEGLVKPPSNYANFNEAGFGGYNDKMWFND